MLPSCRELLILLPKPMCPCSKKSRWSLFLSPGPRAVSPVLVLFANPPLFPVILTDHSYPGLTLGVGGNLTILVGTTGPLTSSPCPSMFLRLTLHDSLVHFKNHFLSHFPVLHSPYLPWLLFHPSLSVPCHEGHLLGTPPRNRSHVSQVELRTSR